MTLEALSQGFQGTVAAVPLRFRFRLGLVLVAIVTVLLPLIYLAMVAGAGYGVYFHLTNNLWLLEGRRSYVVRGILYAAPAVWPAVDRCVRGAGPAAVDGLGAEVHQRTGVVLSRLHGLLHRVLGRLAALAERIEQAADPTRLPTTPPTSRPTA